MVSVVPKEGHETDVFKNPYIAYNCVRLVCDNQVAVVTNGSQTDCIAEKIAMGVPVRDALAYSLLTLDFEKDQYNTPRIASVADKRDGSGWLATVREDCVGGRQVALEPGKFFYLATYEERSPKDDYSGVFPAATPEEACDFMLAGGVFAERTNPVTAVAAMATDEGFALAVKDVAQG